MSDDTILEDLETAFFAGYRAAHDGRAYSIDEIEDAYIKFINDIRRIAIGEKDVTCLRNE